jgi:hypothetical protein
VEATTSVIILNVYTKMKSQKSIQKNVSTLAIVAIIGFASMANATRAV